MSRGSLRLALAAIVATASPASAQAWLQWDQSAAAMGRASAVAAVVDDAGAAFYNPAGIAWLFGTHLRVDGVASRRGGEFEAFGAGGFDREGGFDLAGGLYATHTVSRDLTLGLAVNAPWGLSVEWDRPDSFVGRFRATRTSMRSVSVSPVLAWQALPRLAVAGGPVFTYGVLELDRFEQDPELSALAGAGPIALARSDYELDAMGAGWVVGASWRLDDAVSLGAHLRSSAELDMVGPVVFVDVAPAELRDFTLPGRQISIGEILDERFVSQEAGARLPLPTVASGGVAWTPVERVRLTGDLQWIGWSEAESIELDFVNDSLDDRQPLEYDDTWSVRLGVEVRHRPGQSVRLGFARVESPAPASGLTPLIPDADRDEISGGIGLLWRDVTIDLAYRVAFFSDREGIAFPGESTPDGVFQSSEHAVAIGISRNF